MLTVLYVLVSIHIFICLHCVTRIQLSPFFGSVNTFQGTNINIKFKRGVTIALFATGDTCVSILMCVCVNVNVVCTCLWNAQRQQGGSMLSRHGHFLGEKLCYCIEYF